MMPNSIKSSYPKVYSLFIMILGGALFGVAINQYIENKKASDEAEKALKTISQEIQDTRSYIQDISDLIRGFEDPKEKLSREETAEALEFMLQMLLGNLRELEIKREKIYRILTKKESAKVSYFNILQSIEPTAFAQGQGSERALVGDLNDSIEGIDHGLFIIFFVVFIFIILSIVLIVSVFKNDPVLKKFSTDNMERIILLVIGLIGGTVAN